MKEVLTSAASSGPQLQVTEGHDVEDTTNDTNSLCVQTARCNLSAGSVVVFNCRLTVED